MSPTQRSNKHLKECGAVFQVVERWNSFAKVRIDLFGVIDIVAIRGGQIVGIQATSAANHSARRAKAIAEPRLRLWLQAGGVFEVWSWGKRGERGKRKAWTLRAEPISLADLDSFAADSILAA